MPDDQDPIDGDPPDQDPLDQDPPDLDEAPAEDAAPTGDDGAPAATLAALSSIVGADAEGLYAFGRSAGETVVIGIESVVAHQAEFRDVSARVAEFSELESAFAGSDHLSVEIRVAIDEAEVYSIVAIAALADLGPLFAIDTSPEQMADEEFARGQIEVISSGLKELLDLGGLMLFSDGLAGAEATLGEVRRSAIEETVAALTDAAGDSMGLRIDFTLAPPDGSAAPITVAAPPGLVARLASLASSGEAASPEAAAAPVREPITGMEDEPAAPAFPPLPNVAAPEGDVAVHPVRFPNLGPGDLGAGVPSGLDLIMEVPLRVTVELGRSTMTVEEVLALGPGSIVELNKLAGEPVDILINGRGIARGEVVVVDENFGVRVTEILSPRSRIEAVRR